MQPERSVAAATLDAVRADVLAIVGDPDLRRNPRAGQLLVSLYATAGFRPGTIQADVSDMAAMMRISPRSLRGSHGSPGAVELLEETGKIERHGRSVYVFPPAKLG